jgi:hypothetical protein
MIRNFSGLARDSVLLTRSLKPNVPDPNQVAVECLVVAAVSLYGFEKNLTPQQASDKIKKIIEEFFNG